MTTTLDWQQDFKIPSQMPGLVWAFRADAIGKAAEVPAGVQIEAAGFSWYWLHLNLADSRCLNVLKSFQALDVPLAGFSVIDSDPHIHCGDGLIYGALPDLKREISQATDGAGVLHFIASGNLLITARRETLNAPGAVRKMLLDGARVKTAFQLLETLLDRVIAGADQVLEASSRSVDEIEDRIVNSDDINVRAELGAYRRSAIRLHRHIARLRLMFQKTGRDMPLAQAPEALVGISTKFQIPCELIDREIMALLERIRSLQDEISAMVAEQTNNHLRVMSILTILFMPPTFVAGLFGMNLKGILFGEQAIGFWWGTGLAIAASVIVAFFLRRARIF